MRTALITGASSGLGQEFADLFAREGHSVILVARRRQALQEVAARLEKTYPAIQTTIVDMDLGRPDAGQALYERVCSLNQQVDFVVNNAGFGSTGAFADQPLERELQLVDLNMRVLVEITHLFLPQMLERRFGRILNVGSTAGFQPGPYMSTYYASKAFVVSFSEGLHEELKGTGVTCTVLAPGATATEFSKVSGNDESRLFRQGAVAKASDVASYGYRSMQQGRALAIPGMLNQLLVQTLRISPRVISRKIAAYLNRAPGAG